MNKTAIKNFAVWARRKLIGEITDKARLLGVTEVGVADPLPQSTKDLQFFDIGTKNYAEVQGVEISQRNALVSAIKAKTKELSLQDAFQNVVEEIAYTWFNRMIAIRFMEVNDYLPSRVRVLSSENPSKLEPDFVTTPFDTDLDFTSDEQERVMQLKDENKLDELFRMLFIKQCNKLHEILPELFEATSDYTELLLTISFTDKDGVVYHLTHDIPEDNFNVEKEGQIEIIGWLYQYYNDDRKNEIINIYKGTVKKYDIPAATQLFTTDWVVRYIVDNSLGRYWIERHPESNLASKLQFLVTPKNGELQHVDEKIQPEEISFLDPCMGSAHILVYAFDVLMEIYRECGYTDRDAASMIVQNNLYGMDIDERASQLAYFAVMMKARSYDRRFLSRDIKPNIFAIKESNGMGSVVQNGLTTDVQMNAISQYLVDTFRDAKELGSIIMVELKDYDGYVAYLDDCDKQGQLTLDDAAWMDNARPMLKVLAHQACVLSRKYSVVCTNPPYLNKIEGRLKTFVTENYKDYSGDLFSVFTYRNLMFCKRDGYCGYMTPFVWMFIKTYEKLREFIIQNKCITTLVQMEYSAFEEATVPICSFVLKNGKSTENGLYFKLSDFKGGMEVQKQKVLEALADKNCGYFYVADQSNFSKIPGSPVAYWASDRLISNFQNGKLLSEFADVKKGLDTGNNERFLRLWHEIDLTNSSIHNTLETKSVKWIPLQKGGTFKKWYGNNEYVINWSDNGSEIKNSGKASIRSPQFYFHEGISWSTISSTYLGMRYVDRGFIFETAGNMMFPKNGSILYCLGFLCGKIPPLFMQCLNPTITTTVGSVSIIPLVYSKSDDSDVTRLSQNAMSLSKEDWDSYETSWDFKRHSMIAKGKLTDVYTAWKADCEFRFLQLKANEEELNRIFIDIYGLQDELTPDVADKDVTVHRIFDTKDDVPESMKSSNYVRTMRDEIVSLISYAVGCMFGRYSLDVDGLAYAGGEWDSSKYQTFQPDPDNCIPITDEEYFQDDIVGRFVEFVRTVYGADTLEENLDFIAKALSNKGNTSREIIRNYFLTDFIKDHIKTYQKRPIYWMFDSGKQNGFKALVYMHRWNADTTGNVRVEYLHRIQRVYESEINRMQDTIDNSSAAREISAAQKRKDKLAKQLKESKDYDAKIAHLALSRIDIDLDDGVKVNYEKVQTGQDGKKIAILTTIK